MSGFLQTLAGVSVTGGVFILAAILVRSGVKNRLPKHFPVLLWAAVLAHFIILPGIASPTSVYNYVAFRAPVSADARAQTARLAVPASGPEDAPEGAPGSVFLPADADGKAGWATAVFYIWLGGAALLLAFFLGAYWRTVRRFDCAFLLKNQPNVDAWRRRQTRPVRIYVSDRTDTPLAFGLLRPRIVLPRTLDLSDAALVEGILQHEYTHCRHFHNAMKMCVYLVLAAHWFNPLVWLYWLLFSHDVELACDESVIAAIGPSRRAAYAHSLVAVASKMRLPFPLASAFSARSLKERIVDIMGYKRTTALLAAAEVLLIALLFALFGTSAAYSRSESGTPAAVPLVSEAAGETPFPEGADPLAAALAVSGGGVVIKHEVDREKEGLIYEYKIVSGDHEYTVKINPDERTLVKYERKGIKKPFVGVDFSQFVGMDRACAAVQGAHPRAALSDCELKPDKRYGFVYEIEFLLDGGEQEALVEARTGRILSVKSEEARPRKPRPR